MAADKIFGMSFAKVYPLLIAKATRKGRTQAEVDEVTCWLTGYGKEHLRAFLESDLTYDDFFRQAPALNPNRKQITGVVCGIRVENIEDPLDAGDPLSGQAD